MSEISHASDEQSAGIEQVNAAITEMDQATQQNAALVEQVAAAAQSLQEQSVRLAQAVGRFRIADPRRAPATEPATSAVTSGLRLAGRLQRSAA